MSQGTEPQLPFGFGQGRLSTPLGTKYVPNSAQDDKAFKKRILDSGHQRGFGGCEKTRGLE